LKHIFADKFFYSVDEKNPNNIDDTIGWLKEIAEVDRLDIMGGEPLYNKNFIPVISSIKSKQLAFSTNLSFKDTSVIDTILNLSSQYEEIFIRVSIDSTDKNAEFSRFGLDYQKFLSNLHYLINHAQSNVKISIGSLMTSITIRDLNNTITLVKELHELNPTSVLWDLAYCQDPKIFTLNTLPDKFKLDILNQLNTVKELSWVKGVDTLIGAVNGSKFNGTLYGLMKHFVKEFSERKGIVVPFELE